MNCYFIFVCDLCLQVSVNGFMTFLSQLWGIWPPPSSSLESVMTGVNTAPVVLSPFWADGVTGSGNDDDGMVYYHSYTKYSPSHQVGPDVDEIMDRATGIVRVQTGNWYFVASNVIVVTWSNLRRFGGPADEVSQLSVCSKTKQ